MIWLDPGHSLGESLKSLKWQDLHPLPLTPTLLLQSQGSNPESGAQLFSFGKQGIKVGGAENPTISVSQSRHFQITAARKGLFDSFPKKIIFSGSRKKRAGLVLKC